MNPTTSSRRTAAWLAAGLVLLPVLVLAPIEFERTAAVLAFAPALALGRGALACMLARLMASRARAVWLAGGLVLLAACVACADQPAPAAVEAANWLVWAGVALTAAGAVATGDATVRRTLLCGVLASGALGAGVLAWTWFLGVADPRELRGTQIAWFYPHIRHVGLHLAPAWIAAWALLVWPPASRGARGALVAAAVLVSSALLWSGSRGPLVGLTAALGVAVITLRGSERKRAAVVWGALLVVGLLGSLACWHPDPAVGWWGAWRRSVEAAGDATALTSHRDLIWTEVWRRAQAAPWLGHGPDGYRFLMPKLEGQQPHNLALQVLIDTGWLGVAWCALGLAWLVPAAWRGARTSAAAPAAWLVACGVTAGFLDGVFYHAVAVLPLAVGAGLLVRGEEPTASPGTARTARVSVIIAGFAATAAALVLALHAVVFQRVSRSDPPTSPDAAAARLWRAFPSTTYRLERWLDAWWPAQPEVALEWARLAAAHSATPHVFHKWRVETLARAGRMDEARAALADFEAVRPGRWLAAAQGTTPAATPESAPPDAP